MSERTATGVVRTDEVYPLDVFRKRTGLESAALAAARERGLPVIWVGRRRFVRGSDWHRWLGEQASQSAQRDARNLSAESKSAVGTDTAAE